MFMMLHSILVFFAVQWLSQHWGEPLVYWLLGYYTASLLATGVALLFVWLSSRKPREVKRPTAGAVASDVCAASAAVGG